MELTFIGWIFWGSIAAFLLVGFVVQKIFGTKAPKKTGNQTLYEENARNVSNSYMNND